MTSSISNISINFKDNRTAHKDIILKILHPKQVRKFDSYYFILDNNPESIEGAIESLIKLLQYWIVTVNQMNKQSTKYLPIDFSDQYLGVFKVIYEEELLSFEYGYTLEICGYSISPSNPEVINIQEIAFKSDSKDFKFKITKNDFISDIEKSIDILTNTSLSFSI